MRPMISYFASSVSAAINPTPAIMRCLWWYLWIAPNVLCAVALVVALRKRCLETLPWFVILLGYCTLKFLASVSIRSHTALYERIGVFDILVSTPLELAVIYELANKLILSHSALARLLGPLPRWTAAALLLLATLATAFFLPPIRDHLMLRYASLSLFNDLLESSLLLALLLAMHFFGTSLRSLAAGAVVGMGVTNLGGMAGIALLGQMKTAFATDIIRGGAWHLGVLVWFFYLGLYDGTVVDASESATEIPKLEPHSQELQRLFRR